MSSADTAKTSSWRRWGVAVALGLLVAGWVGYWRREQTLPAIGSWLDVGEPPQKTDAVMLLGGDRDTRTFRVADLYLQDFADQVLITTGQDADETARPRGHRINQEILLRCGVPSHDIVVLDTEVGTTFDEAQTLSGYLSEHPGHSVTVVTNDYHTRRSRWVFRQVLGHSAMQRVHFVSAPPDRFHAGNWWKNEDGFTLYMAEFFKFSFYLVRYSLAWLWCLAGIVVVAITIQVRRRFVELSSSREGS